MWTWNITKLALVTQGIYLALYAVTDLFSRHTVAWMVSLKENSAVAMQLMDEASALPHRTGATHLASRPGFPHDS